MQSGFWPKTHDPRSKTQDLPSTSEPSTADHTGLEIRGGEMSDRWRELAVFVVVVMTWSCVSPAVEKSGEWVVEPESAPSVGVGGGADLDRGGRSAGLDAEFEQIHELHVEKHDLRGELMELYDRLEGEYGGVDGERDELDEEARAAIDRIERMHRRIEERYRLVEDHVQKAESHHRSAGDDARSSPHHDMMGDRRHLQTIAVEHRRAAGAHNRLVEASRQTDRVERAELHETLAELHARCERLGAKLEELIEIHERKSLTAPE